MGALSGILKLMIGAFVAVAANHSELAAAELAVERAVHSVPCNDMSRAKLKNGRILTATEVEGVLPEIHIAPSLGHDRKSGKLDDLPRFCRVVARLSPVPESEILIEIWLPQKWNEKLLAIGNHGYGGEFEHGDMVDGLNRGYATVITNTGHTGRHTPESGFQGGFSVGDARLMMEHGAAVDDYAWRAVHEMAVAAKVLVKHRYGMGPRLSYFNGCSLGGRQAMREAIQFPEDFDGIISGAPAMYWTRFMAADLRTYLLGDLGHGTRISREKLKLAHEAVLAKCDLLDNLADGLLADPLRCYWKPEEIQCESGNDGADCLTAAEVAAVGGMLQPLTDPETGEWLYDGWVPGGELMWASDVGNMIELGFPTANHYRYEVLRDPSWQPDGADIYELLKLAEAPGSPGSKINTISTDLSAYRERGGKIIQYHGWADQAMPALWQTRYYNEVVSRQNDEDKLAATQSFYRLFMVPGMAHCFGGTCGPTIIGALSQPSAHAQQPKYDILEALDMWVEKGVAPEKIIATAPKKANGLVRQMPLCPFPQVAIYHGGDVNSAESFACKAPQKNPGGRK